ncbi:hypothetical protein RvY_01418 [Ramazzottius varieornatus]|uniref:Uncharacterized protein n=1 Tax=Ramazzottius varieornatus TaxID=947166 RepID=A0A1D1UQY9_RAMVA|nr:hypothetical protein RvY_01418 [Ramazzottius varieornatus]
MSSPFPKFTRNPPENKAQDLVGNKGTRVVRTCNSLRFQLTDQNSRKDIWNIWYDKVLLSTFDAHYVRLQIEYQ